MREIARDVVALLGLGLVAWGLWLVYPPAMFIAVGGVLLAGAILWPSDRSDA